MTLSMKLTFQEAEVARKELLELQAVAAAVESSGQAKAEAQVDHMTVYVHDMRLYITVCVYVAFLHAHGFRVSLC